MKKLTYIISGAALLIMACTKDLSNLNIDTKRSNAAPSHTFFGNAQHSLSNTLTSANTNLNIFRLLTQQWQETQYPDESRYNLANRLINDNFWNALYRDALRDFQEAKNLIPNDIKDANIQKNQLAIVDIMQVYTYYYLLTTYGDVPYTEALDINNVFPKYDDAKTIYDDLLKRLDADINNLNTTAVSFGAADLIYHGDVAMWKKFAASFKLKMGITIADADATKAKSIVESALVTGIFSSNTDNAQLNYQGAPPNTNPIWVDLVQSGRNDFVAASTLVEEMKLHNDPRLNYYFTIGPKGVFTGAEPGELSAYESYSHVNPKITNPTFPSLLLDYSEVEFLLTEAVERKFVPGTANEHYNKAIAASINYWGGTNEQANTYLQQTSVDYTTALGDFKQKIGTQKWIALYNRGNDSWIEQRRLDYPKLKAPKEALSEYPVRFPYPVNEQNVNKKNYENASTAIGGDKVTTKLFWDKF